MFKYVSSENLSSTFNKCQIPKKRPVEKEENQSFHTFFSKSGEGTPKEDPLLELGDNKENLGIKFKLNPEEKTDEATENARKQELDEIENSLCSIIEHDVTKEMIASGKIEGNHAQNKKSRFGKKEATAVDEASTAPDANNINSVQVANDNLDQTKPKLDFENITKGLEILENNNHQEGQQNFRELDGNSKFQKSNFQSKNSAEKATENTANPCDSKIGIPKSSKVQESNKTSDDSTQGSNFISSEIISLPNKIRNPDLLKNDKTKSSFKQKFDNQISSEKNSEIEDKSIFESSLLAKKDNGNIDDIIEWALDEYENLYQKNSLRV